MEQALYHPDHGYYERAENPIGRAGDYVTSVSVGPLFGQLLAAQFMAWGKALPVPWQILEVGAHDGRLAGDILGALPGLVPPGVGRPEYWVIEPSVRRRAKQEETLRAFGDRVRWFKDWGDLPDSRFSGLIFANELLDAFPVHRLGWDALQKRWFEWGVRVDRGTLRWGRMIGSEGRAAEWITDQGRLAGFPLTRDFMAVLPDGFTTEINPQAVAWWAKAASVLRHGRLLTLDYGYEMEEFFLPERARGNVQAYYRHRHSDALLARPGSQDLIAPVNFTLLRNTGEQAGLKTDGLFSQAQFLTRVIQGPEVAAAAWTPAQVRQFQTLTHPDHLGRACRVLVQYR